MAIDTFDIVTLGPEFARGRPGNLAQDLNFVFGRLCCVCVCAFISIWAVVAQEMNIAHFDFLNSFVVGHVDLD